MNSSEKKLMLHKHPKKLKIEEAELESKEGFCGACVAGIGALAGIGTAAGSTKIDKKKRSIVFWVGCSVSILSILVLLYLLFVKKCSECL